jgi:Ca-activated chloride channel family protein
MPQPKPKAPPAADAAPEMEASAPAPSAPPRSRADKKEGRKGKGKGKGKRDRASAPAAPEMAAEAGPVEEDAVIATDEPVDPMDEYHDWGQSIYLSNDDTMSLSSAQRVIFAIDSFLPLPPEHIRPHELLNYFSFDVADVDPNSDFGVLPGVLPKPNDPGIYSLGLAVRGWPLDESSRRNAQLSIVVDRSGSMSAQGRMEYLKRGLLQMTDQLKRGDIVNLTLFDHNVCVPVQNFVVGRDDMNVLRTAIHRMQPQGSTDLHSGLRTGYDLADKAYQPTYTNRVVMITDALTNTGVTDERLISMVGQYYDSRRIRLSGVGVGREFNDSLLDKLTERGRGAYVFLGSEAEVDAVFGSRFVSLIETTATDVHFRLHLPPSLRMNVFYGEESSVYKEDVQAIHYFANTSQLFLQDVMARGGELRPEDQIMLTIEYEHPETGAEQVEEYAFALGEMQAGERNVKKGLVLMRFIDGLAWMSQRQYQGPARMHFGKVGSPGTWNDPEAYAECQTGREQLEQMARGIEDDPEVRRVKSLWDRYCARFEQTRSPVRRQPGQRDAWPSAAE